MIFYCLIIAFFMTVIVCLNLLLGLPAAMAGQAVSAVLGSTLAVICLDGIVAFAIRRLPERCLSAEGIFYATPRECRFYRAIGVRRWRTRIPELGILAGFRKNRVQRPGDRAYIARFILECKYGILIHVASVPVGFLVLLCYPPAFALGIGLPVAAVNTVLNLLPCFVLRYNLPKLRSLQKRNERKQEKPAC